MTQDLTSDEQYMNTLLQKQRELSATGSDSGTNVSIASPSRLPREPVGPQRLRSIIIAFLLLLMAGGRRSVLLYLFLSIPQCAHPIPPHIYLYGFCTDVSTAPRDA